MPTDEQTAEWEALKIAWQNGLLRAMPPKLFCALFWNGSLSQEAVALARQSTIARQALKDSADDVFDLRDRDVWSVWVAVQNDEAVQDLFAHRRNQLSAVNASRFVRDAVRHVIDLKGRKFIKARALKLWGPWQTPKSNKRH